MKAKKKTPPSSLFRRTSLLLGTGASVLSKELGSLALHQFQKNKEQLIKNTRLEQIKIITTTLSHLKGSAMKFGQILSLEAQDILPPEALEILAVLQKNAAPIDNFVLFDVIQQELGEQKLQQLNIVPLPIDAASIGQVYLGNLKDKAVAIKVQYPEIAKSISSDLSLMRKIAPTLLSLLGKHIDIQDLLSEIEMVFQLETDYKREASLLSLYQEMLKHDPRFLVPTPITEYSTDKVLTMEFVEGVTLREWILQGPSLEQRSKIGQAIVDLYITEFFQHGLVQTDPNLANFLIQEQPQGLKLVLLDCGAVLKYKAEFIQLYRKLVQIMLSESDANIIQFCEKNNLLDNREPLQSKSLFIEMIRASILPFQENQQPFRFSDKDYSLQLKKVVVNFSRAAKYTKPRNDFVFLHRKLGGVFHILKMLDLDLNLTPFWQQAMTLEFKDENKV